MRMTKKDHEERLARLAAGQGNDEDRRLVKLYESQEHDEPAAGHASVSHSVALDDGGQAVDEPRPARRRGTR